MNNMAQNMAQMNPGAMVGGPVGVGPMPMMANAAAGAQQQGPRSSPDGDQRSILNTYIYEYFVREGMYECARAMLAQQDEHAVNVVKGQINGRPVAEHEANDDAMDTDNKDGVSTKRPGDLPDANVPSSDTCFLYEWFCLFWDMLMAQRNKGGSSPQVGQYVGHTQQQSRARQNQQQQELLRNLNTNPNMFGAQNPMMGRMPNGMIKTAQGNLARTAMANNQTNPTAAMQMMQKQQSMQRDGSEMDGIRRPASPGSADNAPSPKRARPDGAAPFNAQQVGMMQNGQRPQQGMPGNQVGNGPNTSTAQAAAQLLQANGINPSQLTAEQFQAFQNANPGVQAKSIASYSQNLQQHHGQQMPNKGPMPGNPNGPPGQQSPMMPGPEGTELRAYYNPGEMTGPTGIRPAPAAQGAGGSNHALQDYQMQLMLLEQQNKKRLMMARQEQDSMGSLPRDGAAPGGPGGPGGPNGQPFQDTSPQGGRPGASPNPSEQMKRGTPQMNPAGIPSPLPEGAQSRGSPNPMGFNMPNNMPNGMDPNNMPPHFFKGMEGNMNQNGMVMNGMRPPSSHPGQPFNGGQMTPQMMARQQQQQQAQQQQQPGGPGGMPWQGGQQNGNGMNPQQGPQAQVQGTPTQRSMPPPSAPAAGAAANNANGRNTSSPQTNTTQPPTPQQSKKAAPKKKDPKGAKAKATNNKANQNAAATPAAEQSQDAEPPTPATPITPSNFKNGSQPNAAPAPPANSAPGTAPQQPAPTTAAAQPDPAQMTSFGMDNSLNTQEFNMDFANPLDGTGNVLQDFDFDSFLHEDGDGANFGFDASAFGMEPGGEITNE